MTGINARQSPAAAFSRGEGGGWLKQCNRGKNAQARFLLAFCEAIISLVKCIYKTVTIDMLSTPMNAFLHLLLYVIVIESRRGAIDLCIA